MDDEHSPIDSPAPLCYNLAIAAEEVSISAPLPLQQDEDERIARLRAEASVRQQAEEAAINYARMLRDIRSWGAGLLLWGVTHLAISGLFSAPWGILLLLVGLASFYFRAPAMFVVYGVILAWAAVSNLLSAKGLWVAFALLQIYLAYAVFRQFSRSRHAEADYATLPADARGRAPLIPARAARTFPWLACALGVAALTGAVAVLGLAVAHVVLTTTSFPMWFEFTLNLGVLGLAVGTSSLFSDYRPKLPAALGAAAGALVLMLFLAMAAVIRVLG